MERNNGKCHTHTETESIISFIFSGNHYVKKTAARNTVNIL